MQVHPADRVKKIRADFTFDFMSYFWAKMQKVLARPIEKKGTFWPRNNSKIIFGPLYQSKNYIFGQLDIGK